MKIVAMLDSFKGSISSSDAGHAVKNGILRVYPDAEVTVLPLADGGEGTVDALVRACGGELVQTTVCGPRHSPVLASYGILQKNTAVIEMSAAAGLPLLSPEERDPLRTTTFGVGELIRDAIGRGCRDFLIGIGGSATNDGGAGMLQALGFGLLDLHGAPIPHGAIGLSQLHKIVPETALPALADCRFRVACDVTNPLCGENGCSAIFSPQKGARKEDIPLMDRWLARYAELTYATLGRGDATQPGVGAAGGLGFAFAAYLNATLASGIDLVLDAMHADEILRNADLVVTGEGRLDGQSAMGKAPVGVARLAKKHQKPVIAFAGAVTDDATRCNTLGIDAFFPILRGVVTLEEAMNTANAKKNLADTAEQVFRLLRVSGTKQ